MTTSLAEVTTIGTEPDAGKAVDLLGQLAASGLDGDRCRSCWSACWSAVAQLGQTGLVLSLHPLKPDFKRLNPITGREEAVVDALGVGDGQAVGQGRRDRVVCRPHIQDFSEQLTAHGRVPLLEGLADGRRRVAGHDQGDRAARSSPSRWSTSPIQRRKHSLDLKMTKQEVRDEMRSSEGDPQMKGRIRSMQMRCRGAG